MTGWTTYDELTDSRPHPFVNASPLNMGTDRTKVAIAGFEEQNGQTAPYNDPDWDIWGFNMANRLGFMRDGQGRFRADAWFDLHEEHAQNAKDMAWIRTCPVPLYLTHTFGENPRGYALDLDALMDMIRARYGITPPRYFASSFAYATALAIGLGYRTIGFFGVSLDWGRERIVERGNLEYWIGLAQGLGIQLEFSKNSKLLTHPALYGIQYDQEKREVEDICVNTVRQLLQSPGICNKLDHDLLTRTRAMEDIRQQCANHVERIIYQSAQKEKL